MDKILNNRFFAVESLSLPERNEIDTKYKWNLNDIYDNENQKDADFDWVKENIERYKDFKGTLSRSALDIYNCFKFDEEVNIKIGKLHLYAMLKKDQDMRDSISFSFYEKLTALYTQAISLSAFITPEILEIPEDKLNSFLQSNELQPYKHLFDSLLRMKPHTLDAEKEQLLAMASDALRTSYNAFSIFTNSDMKFPVIKDENGNDIEISHGRFYKALYSKDRNYRMETYKNYYKPFITYANTLATLFNGQLKSSIFYTKAKRYNSSLEKALYGNNIPVDIYTNLISTVSDNLEPMYRWAALKKKLLKTDELHPYDVYVTLVDLPDKEYTYEQGVELVLEALKPLGEEYIQNLKNALENRWLDVYETRGKRSGAYSTGTTYGVHPYVLLNWNGTLNDVFTLAHEMGHNMHSFFTLNNQPYQYASYTIFLAEVASTFNEAMLLDYLIEHTVSKKEKLALIEKYLNDITATFYRQTMFAEFEKMMYQITESGDSLSADDLRKYYAGIYKKYWGSDMVLDVEEEYTWARIPHFYYDFYVYQYATGFAASEALHYNVKNNGPVAVKNYLDFLKAGESKYSIDILKDAGIDMNSPAPILAVTKKMNSLLDEMENILNS